MSSTNQTLLDDLDLQEEKWDPQAPTFTMAAQVTMFLAIATVNILTLVVMAMTPKLRTIPNTYISALAVSDLVVSLNQLLAIPWTHPVHHEYFESHPSLCMFFKCLLHVNELTSILTIALIGLDRFLYIRHPFWYLRVVTKKKVKTAVVVIWLAALAIALPIRAIEVKGKYRGCSAYALLYDSPIAGYVHGLLYFIICGWLFVTYGVVIRTALKQARAIQAFHRRPHNQHFYQRHQQDEALFQRGVPKSPQKTLGWQSSAAEGEGNEGNQHETAVPQQERVFQSSAAEGGENEGKQHEPAPHTERVFQHTPTSEGKQHEPAPHTERVFQHTATSEGKQHEPATQQERVFQHTPTSEGKQHETAAPQQQQQHGFQSNAGEGGENDLAVPHQQRDFQHTATSEGKQHETAAPQQQQHGFQSNAGEGKENDLAAPQQQQYTSSSEGPNPNPTTTINNNTNTNTTTTTTTSFTTLSPPTSHSAPQAAAGSTFSIPGKSSAMTSSRVRLEDSLEARLSLRIVKKMAGVFLCLFVCWTPYVVIGLVGPTTAGQHLVMMSGFLAAFNSAANFGVYALGDREFRAAIVKILCRGRHCRAQNTHNNTKTEASMVSQTAVSEFRST